VPGKTQNIINCYIKFCSNAVCLISRLMAEKVNKEERKNMGEIYVFNEGQEVGDFWVVLGVSESGEAPSEPLKVTR